MYVIWNLTRVCPWDCEFCCVSAVHAKDKVIAKQQKERELSLQQKFEILDMLVGRGWKIDFSGGDPLFYDDDRAVVRRATEMFPREQLSISGTGLKLNADAVALMRKVDSVEFTVDYLSDDEILHRPTGYIRSSIGAIEKLANIGINIAAVTVLYGPFTSLDRLEEIYNWLCGHNVREWSVLRFYPVGRGMDFANLMISDRDYLRIVEHVQSFVGPTKVVVQHSLRVLQGTYRCHAAVETMGILPDGTVTSCAWALDKTCQPLENFRIGKLPEEDLDGILDKARMTKGFCDRKPYCRILSHID